jgi:hypothetical protein
MAEGERNHYRSQSRIFTDPELERAARGTTFHDLRTLPEAELVARYDRLARSEEVMFFLGPEEYLNELTRRENERQGKRIERLTWALFLLTVVLVALELLPRIAGAGH